MGLEGLNLDFEALKKRLTQNGFQVSVFETKEQAAAYLNKEIDQKTVGSGGSVSLQEMGILSRLAEHNTVYAKRKDLSWGQQAQMSANAEVYLMSANAIAADTGEILSIDAVGNRLASSLFGHKKIYMVAGINKISPDFGTAYTRIRNVVAPKTAQRLGRKTPCAANGEKCYNCNSPERICNALLVHYKKMESMDMEIILVNEELGY